MCLCSRAGTRSKVIPHGRRLHVFFGRHILSIWDWARTSWTATNSGRNSYHSHNEQLCLSGRKHDFHFEIEIVGSSKYRQLLSAPVAWTGGTSRPFAISETSNPCAERCTRNHYSRSSSRQICSLGLDCYRRRSQTCRLWFLFSSYYADYKFSFPRYVVTKEKVYGNLVSSAA